MALDNVDARHRLLAFVEAVGFFPALAIEDHDGLGALFV